MGTTAQKLNKILETKEAIRTAINNKGGTLTTTDTFASYPSAIDSLPSGGGGSEGDVNPLQHIIDNHKGDGKPSGEYLFYEYWGSSLDDAINSCDFSGITSAFQMFYNCKNLTSVPLFNTSNCTNMNKMFYQCKKLTTTPQLDTSKVTDMSQMFYQCSNLTTIPQFNTSKVTNISGMFNYCSNLQTIPQLDMSSVKNMSSMFYGCSKLETITLLYTSNVTSMSNVFRDCSSLTTISQLDTSSVTSMGSMFQSCTKITTIPQLDTSKVTNMQNMFSYCYKLTTIDITHMKITSTYYSNQFAYYCSSLTKLIIRNMITIPALSSDAFGNCYHFTGTTDATYNPQGLKDGRIYVPDDKVDALKTATNWSVYADIIVPLSTLVE